MITAVIGEKGGCGKSTIAVHLAGWRRAAGHEVLLIDSDRQGTATLWAEARDDRGLAVPDTVQQFGRSIRRTALGFSRRYDDIVIDVAGGDEVAIATSLRIAQQAIVPFQPNELERDEWIPRRHDRARNGSERRAPRPRGPESCPHSQNKC